MWYFLLEYVRVLQHAENVSLKSVYQRATKCKGAR